MNRWLTVLLLLLPLLIVALLARPGTGGWVEERLPDRFTTREAPTPTSTPAFKAARDLQALEVADAGAICGTGDGEGTPAPWSNRVVLVDIASGKPVDTSTALGPKLDPTAVHDMQFVTVSLRRPAWDLAPGDTVTLVAVPPGTPAAEDARNGFLRLENVTIVTVSWDSDSKPGDDGFSLVVLPAGNDAFVDLVAAGGVAIPFGAVSTQAPTPAPDATMAPTIATCPTPAPAPTATKAADG